MTLFDDFFNFILSVFTMSQIKNTKKKQKRFEFEQVFQKNNARPVTPSLSEL